MKSYKLHYEAEHRLDESWEFTFENWGSDQANRYLSDIETMCLQLAKGKIKGRPFPGHQGLKYIKVNRHIVFYIEEKSGIVLLTVLHEVMDLPQRIKDILTQSN